MAASGIKRSGKHVATRSRPLVKKRQAALKKVVSKRRPAARKTQQGRSIYQWEETLWARGFKAVAGTDEAGRGPLAGPVVAAAFVVLRSDDAGLLTLLRSITDSKLMTARHREEAFAQLTSREFRGRVSWAIAESSPSRIDKINILQASLEAMAKAVRRLKVKPDCVLVDGCNRPPDLLHPGESWTRGAKNEKAQLANTPAELRKVLHSGAPQQGGATARAAGRKWTPRRVVAVIGGDAKVVSIAAASVLAKVHRDRIMARLHNECPMYGFSDHKGYPTAVHRAAIVKHGVSRHHRRSFGPVARVLEKRGSRKGK